MTAAYVPAAELSCLRFQEHLKKEGFDLSEFSQEELVKLMFATASFFDEAYPTSPLCSLLQERVQV